MGRSKENIILNFIHSLNYYIVTQSYFVIQAIGNRLDEMLIEDKKHLENVTNLVTDPDGQRELLQQDEEEDFLDEGIQYDTE